MKRYSVDCSSVRSFEDFVGATNVAFIRPVGGEWNGNLDAFNDYLSWPKEAEYELEFMGAGACAKALGHPAMATWLRGTLRTCHPDSIPVLQRRLDAAERGEGQTLFELVREIVADNEQVRLILS
jgi:hypothetical protein